MPYHWAISPVKGQSKVKTIKLGITDGNDIDHRIFLMYINVKSICCTPETIKYYANYT